MIDEQSSLAFTIKNANSRAYEALVVEGGTPKLAHDLLDGIQPQQLLAVPAVSPATAQAALAGLWLWHDGLAESHAISQSLHNSTGSFWHAIMHRREGDFSNSKYWYANARSHPALAILATQAAQLLSRQPADRSLLKIIARGFDPSALVDFIEEVHATPTDTRHPLAVRLQQLEWHVLFNHL